MIKLEVLHVFRLKEYRRIFDIFRMDKTQPYDRFIKGDTFYTDEDMARYLLETTEEQPYKLVKVVEIIPDNDKNMA